MSHHHHRHGMRHRREADLLAARAARPASAAASPVSRSRICSSRKGLLTAALPQPFSARRNPLAPKPPPLRPRKAKAVISIFCYGGVSQIDTFDPKPDLLKWQGETMQGVGQVRTIMGNPGGLMPSPWTFKKYGQSRDGRVGAVPAHRAARRRHRVHPVDVRRQPGARTGAVPDEHRQHPRRASERRQLGHLRPRQREREPAGLHRLHRLPRRSDQRPAELEQRLSARGVTRARRSATRRDADRRSQAAAARTPDEQREWLRLAARAEREARRT